MLMVHFIGVRSGTAACQLLWALPTVSWPFDHTVWEFTSEQCMHACFDARTWNLKPRLTFHPLTLTAFVWLHPAGARTRNLRLMFHPRRSSDVSAWRRCCRCYSPTPTRAARATASLSHALCSACVRQSYRIRKTCCHPEEDKETNWMVCENMEGLEQPEKQRWHVWGASSKHCRNGICTTSMVDELLCVGDKEEGWNTLSSWESPQHCVWHYAICATQRKARSWLFQRPGPSRIQNRNWSRDEVTEICGKRFPCTQSRTTEPWGRRAALGEGSSWWSQPPSTAEHSVLGVDFALRSGNEHRQLWHKGCQVEVVEQPGECPYLQYTEDISKNNQGGIKCRRKRSKKVPKVIHHSNEVNPSRCLVWLFKLYNKLGPKDRPERAFYLQPLRKPKKEVWFSVKPSGHNTR